MFGRDRGDRGAFAGLALALAAILIIYAIEFSSPPSVKMSVTNDRSVESVYWGFFTIRDTAANWVAALAAVSSVFVSYLAVRYVRSTLKESRRGARAAIAANRNTLRAISQDQRNSEIELRPYVHVSDAGIIQAETAEEYQVVIACTNFGQTPAIDVSYLVKISFAPKMEIPTRCSPKLKSGYYHVDEIPPGHTRYITSKSFKLYPKGKEALSAYLIAIHVWGGARYKDGFGSRYSLCFRRTGESLPIAKVEGVITKPFDLNPIYIAPLLLHRKGNGSLQHGRRN